MKRTWIGIIAILGIGILSVFATQAYFSSNQTIQENNISTGSIDLTLNGQEEHESITLENMKPGEVRKYAYILKNEGTLSAQPSITFGEVSNSENECTEPEDIKDNTCTEAGPGELGANLQIKAEWKQSGTYQNIKLKNKSGTTNLNAVSGITAGLGLMNIGGIDHAIPVMNAGDEVEVRLTFTLPTNTSNIIQSDSSTVDIGFNLNQI
jgi:hypothetical protein